MDAETGFSTRKFHGALLIAAICVLIIAPTFIYPVFLMKVLCFALFACAFNLLLGYGGMLSFGHAAYFGSASYVTGYAAKAMALPPELAIVTGTSAAALLGLIFGLISISRRGIYFSMITLALAQMIFFFCLQAEFTGGEDGLQNIPRGYLFGFIDLGSDTAMYATVSTAFIVALVLIYRIIHSPFGQTLKAIRDNEARAISLGYQTNKYKLLVFVLSASLAGLAGSMKAIVFQLASLTDVHWSMSGEVILMSLIGGMGTIFGPFLGAIAIVSMQNYLASLGAWVTIVQGAVFIICVMLFREGIVGLISRKIRKPL
ncbi:branched-chain amino acid ABC transporter permease [Neorhizobium sp. S3-V5DH]|uniref:branched-chain amino acid ABC transporter permease n=1 Tax=Neorhizobium sp. S3-V5DH TaxID=2485166 RepID=UPI001FE0491F|nr:branched-chain amino acid ABC transporter permease [Neorhizobium sp. S3-V5DH]